jgi:DNA-binding transcriptional ArsR family regulator
MNPDTLDAIFGALADPTRRAILARLASGAVTVNELAQPFAMTQPAVSKHLKVLERAGLIARSRDAQRRPRRLHPEALKTVADWVAHYEHFWTESFDRLDEYLQTLKSEDEQEQPKASASRSSRRLDTAARKPRPRRTN